MGEARRPKYVSNRRPIRRQEHKHHAYSYKGADNVKRRISLQFSNLTPHQGARFAQHEHRSESPGHYVPYLYLSMLVFPISIFVVGFLALTEKHQPLKKECVRSIVLFGTFLAKFVIAIVLSTAIVFVLVPEGYRATAFFVTWLALGLIFFSVYAITNVLIAYKKLKHDVRIPIVDNMLALLFA